MKATYKEGPMNLRTLAALAVGLAAAGALSAQSVTLRAKIPFGFVVNGKSLPAGEYTVRQANFPGTMIISGVDHSVGAVTLVSPTSAPSARHETARLVFDGYGGRYFLSQIWTDGTRGSQIPVARSERELVAHGNNPKRAVVATFR
jgi:hypothetical protein